MNSKKVWFITGASQGLGLALAKKLLANGYAVVATSRKANALEQNLNGSADSFLPLAVNLTDEASVQQAVEEAIAHFGQIDVVVNNAGYALAGGLEELSDAEVKANFDVNVFGSLHVIRAVLPHLRRQGSGHIFNISSIGGFTGGFPAFGIYCATKFAVHGFTEALAAEVAPFGIHATVVMPGYFRTNFLTESSLSTPRNEIEAYKNVREMQAAHQQNINNNQPGDPDKAADVLIAVAGQLQPPVHLFLGPDAYDFAQRKIVAIQKDMEAQKELATSTNL